MPVGDAQATPVPHALATASTPRPGANAGAGGAARTRHFDLGLAVSDLCEPLRSVMAQASQARYGYFGIGDLRYLGTKHHGPLECGRSAVAGSPTDAAHGD